MLPEKNNKQDLERQKQELERQKQELERQKVELEEEQEELNNEIQAKFMDERAEMEIEAVIAQNSVDDQTSELEEEARENEIYNAGIDSQNAAVSEGLRNRGSEAGKAMQARKKRD